MTISDIITIVSLLIAIVAIISEKGRSHILLKFSGFELFLYIIAFIFINYFVFFNEFYTNGLYLEFLLFKNFGLKEPSIYAYIIAIICLISVLFKVRYSFFPNKNKQKVIKFYKSLIEKDEITILLDLLERYHVGNIIKLLKNEPEENEDTFSWLNYESNKESIKERINQALRKFWININAYSKINKNEYAILVLHNIFNNQAFISLSANKRPYLFASLFPYFTRKDNLFPKELINNFLKEIIKSKNFWLVKELKQSGDFDSGQPEWYFNENNIVASLIKDVKVADINCIWVPFGEEAIKELENEKYIGDTSRLIQIYRNNDILWEYKTYISIKFFDILIIESIVQKYNKSHFFFHYYWFITQKILDNFNSIKPIDFEDNDTYYHHLIELMFDNLYNWLTLCIENEFENRFISVCKCIGNLLHEVTQNKYYGETRKVDAIKRLFSYYCYMDIESNEEQYRIAVESTLKNPYILTKPDHPYFNVICKSWQDFDKIPHNGFPNDEKPDYFLRLIENVIIPLGLNPDEN